jgi:hypothetical protein
VKACTKQLKSTAGGGVQFGELEQACQLGRKGLSERWVILDFTEWPPPRPPHRSVYSRGGAGTRYEGRGIAYSLVRLKQFASSVGMAPDSAVVFRTLRANQETHVSQLRWPVKLLVACTTCRERWDTHNSCRRVNRPISVGTVPTTSGAPVTTMRVRTLWKLPISVGIVPVISFDSSEPASLWNRSTRQP